MINADDFLNIPEFDSSKTYNKGDVISYKGIKFVMGEEGKFIPISCELLTPEQLKTLTDFNAKFIESQVDLPEEDARILEKNIWDLI